jgi:organic radical activating enzyme
MTYAVKEIFYTLQGEGANAGRAAVFCRFCNLWTGREEDRARAVCQFCDTDFVGTDGTRAASTRPPKNWPQWSRPNGRRAQAANRWWSALAASRCCSSTRR